MVLSMRENGTITKPMGEGSSGTLMVMFTKGSGWTIRLTVKAFTFTLMEQNTKANGEMIYRMGGE